jgi:hypothetical protein
LRRAWSWNFLNLFTLRHKNSSFKLNHKNRSMELFIRFSCSVKLFLFLFSISISMLRMNLKMIQKNSWPCFVQIISSRILGIHTETSKEFFLRRIWCYKRKSFKAFNKLHLLFFECSCWSWKSHLFKTISRCLWVPTIEDLWDEARIEDGLDNFLREWDFCFCYVNYWSLFWIVSEICWSNSHDDLLIRDSNCQIVGELFEKWPANDWDHSKISANFSQFSRNLRQQQLR